MYQPVPLVVLMLLLLPLPLPLHFSNGIIDLVIFVALAYRLLLIVVFWACLRRCFASVSGLYTWQTVSVTISY
jgi:hypothetical protein